MKHKFNVLKTRGPDKFDKHEDLRDAGYYTKPTHYQHGSNHNSQKRNEILLSNSIAQSQDNNYKQHPQVSFQKLTHPTFETSKHPNHNYDTAFKTTFKSSLGDSASQNNFYNSFR